MTAWVKIVAVGLKSGRLERSRSKTNRAWLLKVKDDGEVCLGHTEMEKRKRWLRETADELICGLVGPVLLVGPKEAVFSRQMDV